MGGWAPDPDRIGYGRGDSWRWGMRVLIGPDAPLREVYAAPEGPWLRANMVSTVDGASRRRQRHQRLDQHRRGPGRVPACCASCPTRSSSAPGRCAPSSTGPTRSRSWSSAAAARCPTGMLGPGSGPVLLATCSAADGLGASTELLGEDNVMVLGSHRVDLARMRSRARRARLPPAALRGRAPPAARPVRPGLRRRGRHHHQRRCWSAARTRASPTARPSTSRWAATLVEQDGTPDGAVDHRVTTSGSNLV